MGKILAVLGLIIFISIFSFIIVPFYFVYIYCLFIIPAHRKRVNRRCFICGLKDKFLKEVSIYNPRYIDFEFTYEDIQFHDLCLCKAKDNIKQCSDYVKKTIESIENGYLVKDWFKAATVANIYIDSGFSSCWRYGYDEEDTPKESIE